MAVRYLVQDTFQVPHRGVMTAGLLLEGAICTGASLVVEGTGASVRILWVDLHPRVTDDGLVVALRLHPEDAPAVTAGCILVCRPTA